MRNSKCWTGLLALFIIGLSSCASLGSSIATVAFEKDSGILGKQYEVNLFPLKPQGAILTDGNEKYKPTHPGDQFMLVNLRVVNIGSQAVEPLANELVELVYRDPSSHEIKAASVARVMGQGSIIDVKTSLSMSNLLLEPGAHKDTSLAFVLPGKSMVLGLMIDRSLHFDATIIDEALASQYQKWIEAHVNAETVIKMAGRLSFAIIKAMIDMNSFDINITGRKGLTAFKSAVIFGNVETADGLAKAGADTKRTASYMGDEFGLIHMATMSGNPEMLDWVLAHGGNIQAKTHDGRNLFEIAIKSGSVKMAKRVIALGFDPKKEKIKMAWSSMSPLAYAEQRKLADMVQYLNELGVE